MDEKPIASGSIGQVYKGWYKNKLDNNKKIKVAIKVVHPGVKEQIFVPKMFLLILDYIGRKLSCFNKFRSVVDINSFFDSLKKQIDLNNEAINMKKTKDLYKDNTLLVIPKLYNYSSNFIIMSYEDGDFFEDIKLSDYQKLKITCILRLYLNSATCIKNFLHGDLHNGNWKVRKHPFYNIYQIILLDFGICSSIDSANDLRLIHTTMETNNIENFFPLMKKYMTISEDNFNPIKERLKEYFKDKDIKFNDIINYLLDHNIKVDYRFMNMTISSVICIDHINKYIRYDESDKNVQFTFMPELITICKTYDCFKDYCKLLEEKLNKNLKDYNLFNVNGKIISIDSDSEISDSDSESKLV
jgi:predicted unusual protein kinase regulating ubiquinone biosynthesis (AarF/ABC1/UbiB family)